MGGSQRKEEGRLRQGGKEIAGVTITAANDRIATLLAAGMSLLVARTRPARMSALTTRFRGQERTGYVRFDLIRMVIPPATKLKADLRSEWARPNADDITASRVDAYESTDRNYAGLHSLPRMRNLQKGTCSTRYGLIF